MPVERKALSRSTAKPLAAESGAFPGGGRLWGVAAATLCGGASRAAERIDDAVTVFYRLHQLGLAGEEGVELFDHFGVVDARQQVVVILIGQAGVEHQGVLRAVVELMTHHLRVEVNPVNPVIHGHGQQRVNLVGLDQQNLAGLDVIQVRPRREPALGAKAAQALFAFPKELRFDQHPINGWGCRLAEVQRVVALEVGVSARVVWVFEIHPAVEKVAEQAPHRQRLVNKDMALMRRKGIE